MPPWANFLWDAWNDLSDERPMIQAGMGAVVPGAIPWGAIDRWASRHGLVDGDFDFLVRMLRAMDALFASHVNKGSA